MKFLLNAIVFFILSTSSAFAGIIVTSINPIYQIALAITQDKNNTILIINPSTSEHSYNFKKSDAEFISKADLIFYVSNDLEYNFPKIIKTYKKDSQSFQLQKIDGIRLLYRREGDVNKIDPHIWLNPKNAIKIAEFITEKVTNFDQKNAKKYQKNLINFKKEISITEKKIKENLSKLNDKNGYIFYHDAYQYFEDYFAIKPSIVASVGSYEELTSKRLKEIDSAIKTGNVKCIFGEPQDEKNSAIKLAQNFNLKFLILDVIGANENYNPKINGYSKLLLNLVNNFTSCLADKDQKPHQILEK